eukprot:TCALIF_07430-PA protein Name:"Similar to USP35 Ubiquitin carboxyl-terminal hydrolase 35 (Homo sapiens)" AED:0.04 eAED:0.04 QI:47/1/0.90/1/1/1/11/0/1115
MEGVLRQFVESRNPAHSPVFRRQFLTKMFSNLDQITLNPVDVSSLLGLFVQWILFSEDEPLIGQLGHQQFLALSRKYPAAFYEYVTPNFMIDMFTNATHGAKRELVQLVGEILSLLTEFEPERNIEATQRTIVNVTKIHLYACLKEHGVHLPVTREIARVYQNHPCVLPNPTEWSRFSVLIVTLLAGYQIHAVKSDQMNFFEATDEVSQMLPLIWGRSAATDGIQECLKAFYSIISSEGKDALSSPSCGLMAIIDKIPNVFLERATQAILDESSQATGEARTVIGLQTMIKWLTLSRASPRMVRWLLEMLRGLQAKDRNSILIEIAHSCTEPLSLALAQPDLIASVNDIFFFLLLGFQHSESIFHGVVSHIPQTLRSLGHMKSEETFHRLAEASRFLMARFPNFPDLYEPIVHVLEEFKIPEPSEARARELRSLSWLSPIHSTTFIHHQTRTISYLVEDALSFRSETGMVGLINLGNTCYMNSVLQALYITKDFCDDILSAPLTSSQLVLFRLQQVFAYLRYSQRSIYSPGDFLKVARPPWFESGRQQDCSEFLRYLIDTLHEQEKSSIPCRQQPGDEPSKSISTTRSSDEKKETILGKTIVICPLGSTPEEEEIPKMTTRSSNMALDVISEVPETNGDQDEEMLSQCSDGRMDEDFFGSRGSLSAFHNRGDLSEDEEVDLRGSRTSLGSLGMKRWTTEENLSSNSNNGSREDQLNILDEPLNNSHSDSTDSGIQSVGDSIRGSRDSVGDGKEASSSQLKDVATSSTKKSLQAKSEFNLAFLKPESLSPVSSSSSSSTSPSVQRPLHEPRLVSLVQKHLGGKLRTRYQCSKCQNVSEHREIFTELHLAVPADQSGKTNQLNDNLTMQSLVSSYLSEETLEGDNQYHCDTCQGLQDAVKSVHLLEGPHHLLCTLLRFKYDRAVNRKSKVFTNINYKLTLSLPIQDPTNESGQVREEHYALYAIVIHSGYSSDGGHYYTYARPPPRSAKELDCDTWYIFNDSKVSFGDFQSFKDVGKQFPRDVAYQLLYKKMEPVDESRPQRTMGRKPLRADLKSALDKDNLKFLREKERNSNNTGYKSSAWSSRSTRKKDGPDDEDDKDGYNEGGGKGFQGPSLVC